MTLSRAFLSAANGTTFSMGDIPGVVVASKDKPTVGNHLHGAKWLRIMDDTHGQLDATSLVYHTLATLHTAIAYRFCAYSSSSVLSSSAVRPSVMMITSMSAFEHARTPHTDRPHSSVVG